MHAHICKPDKGGCGTLWVHGDENAGNAEAHACPNCGKMVWDKVKIGSHPPTKTNTPVLNQREVFNLQQIQVAALSRLIDDISLIKFGVVVLVFVAAAGMTWYLSGELLKEGGAQ